MHSFRKPTADTIRAFLATQAGLDLTYSEAGMTGGEPALGYAVDHARVGLGYGENVFQAAKTGLERWDHFRLGWTETWPPRVPIKPGEVVGVLAQLLGIWWLNACRIVYVVDEEGPVRRFGFAYGTLPDHVETGEERFLVEWDKQDGSVAYDILAISRPRHIVARLGYPYTRYMQRRFRGDSSAAMLRAARRSGAEQT